MKGLRALNDTPHCSGGKSYARITHEDVYVSYIYVGVFIFNKYLVTVCFFFF
jgi:hypothetical protein